MRFFALFFLALCLAGCGDTDAVPDTGPRTDSGGIDGGGTGPDLGGGDDLGVDMGGGSCGAMQPTISGVSGTEGLVIARDGTLYYSQAGAVGKLSPDGTQSDSWATLPGAATVWGIALDASNTHLYVGSPSTHILYAIDMTTAPPAVTTLAPMTGQPNGVTMGPDGAVYYTDFAGGQVHRVDVTTMASSVVTTSTIAQANGLVFAPGDPTTLYVLSYGAGTLLHLTLDATTHRETARAMVAMSLGNPDGVTQDSTGRFYVTDNGGGRVLRLEADGTGAMMLMGGLTAPANLELGAGPLACHDLYVATGGPLVRIDTMTATSAAVAWH